MTTVNELESINTAWVEAETLELHPFVQYRIRIAIDKGELDIAHYGEWLDRMSVIEGSGRDLDAEMAQQLADFLSPHLSIRKLRAIIASFTSELQKCEDQRKK